MGAAAARKGRARKVMGPIVVATRRCGVIGAPASFASSTPAASTAQNDVLADVAMHDVADEGEQERRCRLAGC